MSWYKATRKTFKGESRRRVADKHEVPQVLTELEFLKVQIFSISLYVVRHVFYHFLHMLSHYDRFTIYPMSFGHFASKDKSL